MIEQGYKRLRGPQPHPYAVAWWYVVVEDGFSFARGGHVGTSRAARRAIADARVYAETFERPRWQTAPTHRLTKDGDLEPLPYA